MTNVGRLTCLDNSSFLLSKSINAFLKFTETEFNLKVFLANEAKSISNWDKTDFNPSICLNSCIEILNV